MTDHNYKFGIGDDWLAIHARIAARPLAEFEDVAKAAVGTAPASLRLHSAFAPLDRPTLVGSLRLGLAYTDVDVIVPYAHGRRAPVGYTEHEWLAPGAAAYCDHYRAYTWNKRWRGAWVTVKQVPAEHYTLMALAYARAAVMTKRALRQRVRREAQLLGLSKWHWYRVFGIPVGDTPMCNCRDTEVRKIFRLATVHPDVRARKESFLPSVSGGAL